MRELSLVPLSEHTTLHVGGVAERMLVCEREQDVLATVDEARRARAPLRVLGGGSNLVVGAAPLAGVVARVAMRGLEIRVDGDVVHVTAQAGEPWDELVARCVAEGWAGVECLSGIPGLAGATPIQNVGAYGQEVGDVVRSVRVLDRATGAVSVRDGSDCAFRYRHSAFKASERHIVLAVELVLRRSRESEPIRYGELARALELPEGGGGRAPVDRVREAVLALRSSKGMVVDPLDPESRSAGSFFMNPIVDERERAVVVERVAASGRDPAALPCHPQADGRFKLSAAWLIEASGSTKGESFGKVAISRKHALALVNRGDATGEEVLDAARIVAGRVGEAFAVRLEPEPVLWGLDW